HASTAPTSAQGYRPAHPRSRTGSERRGSETGRAVERSDVLGFELPDLSGSKLPEPDRPDPDADQTTNRKLDRVEHAPDLARATLDHHQPDAPASARTS